MTATGFTAYAGHKYNVYNNTSDYDVANVRYVEGEDVTTEGYSCLTFTVTKEGGVIEADVTPSPPAPSLLTSTILPTPPFTAVIIPNGAQTFS